MDKDIKCGRFVSGGSGTRSDGTFQPDATVVAHAEVRKKKTSCVHEAHFGLIKAVN